MLCEPLPGIVLHGLKYPYQKFYWFDIQLVLRL